MPRAGRTSRSRRSPRASRGRRRSGDSAGGRPGKPPSAEAASMTMNPRQALWLELMQFYIREAWLLDERKVTEWLGLFTGDVVYFMPPPKNLLRPEAHREMTPPGDPSPLQDE